MYQIIPLHLRGANPESLPVFLTTLVHAVAMEAFTFLWKVILFFLDNNWQDAVSWVIPV